MSELEELARRLRPAHAVARMSATRPANAATGHVLTAVARRAYEASALAFEQAAEMAEGMHKDDRDEDEDEN